MISLKLVSAWIAGGVLVVMLGLFSRPADSGPAAAGRTLSPAGHSQVEPAPACEGDAAPLSLAPVVVADETFGCMGPYAYTCCPCGGCGCRPYSMSPANWCGC